MEVIIFIKKNFGKKKTQVFFDNINQNLTFVRIFLLRIKTSVELYGTIWPLLFFKIFLMYKSSINVLGISKIKMVVEINKDLTFKKP